MNADVKDRVARLVFSMLLLLSAIGMALLAYALWQGRH